MKIIIDTHIFLWTIAGDAKLSKQQRQALETRSNTIYVSAITVTELMIKASIGKLKIDFDPVQIAKQSGFEMIEFTAADALLLKTMPFHHKDPFDRMLIAQGINRNIKLMTEDHKFSRYDCKLF